MSSRSGSCSLGKVGLLALAASYLLWGCGSRQPRQLSVQQFTAIQEQLRAQAGEPPEGMPSAAPTPAGGSSAPPPHDDAERRKRAAAAIPKGSVLADVEPVGNGARYVLSLGSVERAGVRSGPNLLLIDVSPLEGVLIGEHDFGLERGKGATSPPAKISRTLFLDALPEQPVLLAELLTAGEDRQRVFGVCGWWLRRRAPAFLCAPSLTPDSRYDSHHGQLVESWPVDSPGTRLVEKAGNRSGRVLRFADGRWQETDSFRCLGLPLSDAFKDAGSLGLSVWQQDAVRRLIKAARRANESLDTQTALARLDDALAIDGCTPEVWRLLGRLEFEAGHAARAAPRLAIAVALAPRDDAAMLDLADALADLDTEHPDQRESWHTTYAILDSRGPTRSLVEGSAGKSPQALAAAIYGGFLERTDASDELLAGKRKRVEQKLDALGRVRAVRH